MRIDRRAICICGVGLLLHANRVDAGSASMTISLPNGAPLVLSSTAPTPIQINIATNGDTIVAGSVALFHRVAPAAFQQVALTQGGGSSFSGNLPASICGTSVEWYVQAQGVDSGIVAVPTAGAGGPFEAVVGTIQPIVSYNFPSATGWSVTGTVTGGAWAVGVPVGCNRGDPPTDFDGSGSCYLTGPTLVVSPPTCDTDVDGGTTRLVSPVFDLSAQSNPHVMYARWFSNTAPGEQPDDAFTVQISQDGGSNWNSLETVGPTTQNYPHPEVNGGWHPRIVRILGNATNTSAIRFRFAAADLAPASTVEAGLDAFAIVNLTCGGVTCLHGDMTQDGMVDGRDVGLFSRLMVTGGASPNEVCAGDLEATPDGALDAGDIPPFVGCIAAGGCG